VRASFQWLLNESSACPSALTAGGLYQWVLMADSNGKRIVRVSPSVRLAETQDGLVLFDPGQGLCIAINCTGALIWKKACAGCELSQIAECVAEQFGIPAEQAYNDALEFLQQLKEKRLFVDVKSTESKHEHPKKLGWIFRGFWKRVSMRVAKNRK